MRKSIVLLGMCLLVVVGHSQVSGKISGTSSKFKKMKAKILAVEILEEDLTKLDVFKSSKKKALKKKEYQSLVNSYNAEIKNSVSKLWKLNEKIEYKTSSEIDQIIKEKDSKYVLLTYYEQRSMAGKPHEYSNRIDLRKIPLPVLNYVLPETDQEEPECYATLPGRFDNKGNSSESKYRTKDIDFALIVLQKHINEMLSTNKVTTPLSFIKNQANKNCKELSKKTLLLNKSELIKGFNLEKAKKNYVFKLKKTELATIELALLNKEKDKAYSVVLPYGYSQLMLICLKLAVDVETGDILGYGDTRGGLIDAPITFVPSDLKKMSKCK